MSTLAPSLALLAYALFPQSIHADGAGQAGAVDVIAVTPDRAARMTVPVQLGDHGPYRFLIDTGSQNTVVSDVLAERLGLVATARATVIGVAGRQDVGTVELDEIAMGTRRFYGLVAPILQSRDIGADGIVGLDGLQGQRVLLDFTRGVMAIGKARALGGDNGFEIVVTARRRSGQLVMTDARIDGIHVNVVIDTGADVSIGNRALHRALSRRMDTSRTTLLSVTGQQIPADLVTGRKLEMGGLAMSGVSLVFADAPAFEALNLRRRPAILLGMNQLRLFKRVAIDFASRKVLFDPDWEG